MNDLKAVASGLSVQIIKIGRLLDTCWFSSSFRSAVWNGYVALVTYFKEALLTRREQLMNETNTMEFFRVMESIKFLKNLGLMHNVLEEFSNLSLQLQELFCTVTRADKLISKGIGIQGCCL